MNGNEGTATDNNNKKRQSEVTVIMRRRMRCYNVVGVSEDDESRRNTDGDDTTKRVMSSRTSESEQRGVVGLVNSHEASESEVRVKLTDMTEGIMNVSDTGDNDEVNIMFDQRENPKRVTNMNGSAIGVTDATERRDLISLADTNVNKPRQTDARDGKETVTNVSESAGRVSNASESTGRVNDVSESAGRVSESTESSESGGLSDESDSSEARTKILNSSVVKELQEAIISPNPRRVRAILDQYGRAINKQPSGEEEWWPLHLLARAGEDYTTPHRPPQLQSNNSALLLLHADLDDDDDDDITSSSSPLTTTTTPTKPPPHPPWVWSTDAEEERRHRARMTVVHMLVDAGVDVNARDASGLTPLHYAARRGDGALCDALVQCGADLDARHCGVTVFEEVAEAAVAEAGGGGGGGGRLKELTQYSSVDLADLGHLTDSYRNHYYGAGGPIDRFRPQDRGNVIRYGPASMVYRVLRFYWPGLWRAVATQDISKVRQLVNSWCRVELVKGGVSLRELAASTGNEAIISLLVTILPSMSLVHHTLAGNALAVRELLESPARKKINIDIRKLSERGAPLLFFPIRAGHVQVVRELRRHGASLYTQMLDDDMVDVPVIFSALEPWMEPDVVKSLLPASNSREARLLERVWHRGKNILRQAVERGVHIEAIEAILEVGGAALLSERDPVGQTTLDYCLTHDLSSLVALFDLHVAAWLTRPDLYPARRDLLALRGYGRLAEVGARQVKLGQDVSLFLQEYRRCQGVLGEMFAAVREGQGSRLHNLLQYHSHLFHLVDLLWHGRLEGDGMTLLHWAVLHGREGTVGLILKAPHTQTTTPTTTTTPPLLTPTLTTRFSVDDIRDGWGRTPLHYAAGLVEGRGIEAALLHHGCSEHTLDMNGREPLDFKDARGSPALAMLLHNLRNKNHTSPQPDPWDPDTLRAHLEQLRRQRFTSHHHHHHHHHHHQQPHQQQHHRHHSQGSPTTTPYGRHALKTGPPYPYPAHFPTSPGSNFHWPLPRQLYPPDRDDQDEKGSHRICCLM
ncbi:hypothetical protein Pmani_009273 [Petrolisthes manimaculis]|uniref:Uncharacterized protein n=1 Tax=Petrolisthes manimaculis TaxID=1843537 RepID=A0AAE1Q555_9EUCA|nr:hypothetical protein Pmani_009273 [Petrolisthes manimaculis]